MGEGRARRAQRERVIAMKRDGERMEDFRRRVSMRCYENNRHKNRPERKREVTVLCHA